MSDICFVDTETTGLDPDVHEIWEVAVICYDPVNRQEIDREEWTLDVDLGRAEPIALRIGGFHERHPLTATTATSIFASQFAEMTRGCHLAGAVVSFDEERLRKLLRANGACPEWHYHLIDVEALAVGALMAMGEEVQLPWKSDALTERIGAELPTDEQRHTAMGDAQWALNVWKALERS